MSVHLHGIVAAVTTPFTADGSAVGRGPDHQGRRALATDFEALGADAITLPIVYYNVPGATSLRLTVEEIAGLGEITIVKYLNDTSGDAVSRAELLAVRGDPIKALNGWDTLTRRGRDLWRHLWEISNFVESVNYVPGVKAGLDLIGVN